MSEFMQWSVGFFHGVIVTTYILVLARDLADRKRDREWKRLQDRMAELDQVYAAVDVDAMLAAKDDAIEAIEIMVEARIAAKDAEIARLKAENERLKSDARRETEDTK